MHQAFFEHCPEIFVIASADTLIVDVNREAERVLGSRCSRGTSLLDAVHPDDRPAFVAQWARLAEGAAPSRAVSRFRGSDGNFHAFSWSARQAPERGEIHAVLFPAPAVDDARPSPAPTHSGVTTEQILRSILDTLDLAVTVIDVDGFVSHHDGKIVRKSRNLQGSTFVGKNILDLYAKAPEILRNVRSALAGEPVHYIVDLADNLWENWFTPVRDEHGRIRSAIAITLDKSESKRAMQELEQRLHVIEQQQQVIRNLETPVIEVWERVITLPMVGVVDSRRAARVMDDLLAAVVRHAARYAIIDLTGVDYVDTTTASHLIDLVRAIRLLGAEGIITGIRPTVAQTIVTLGLDLSSITTCGTLRDGLRLCIRRMAAENSGKV
ncbi:STAS domain-containing protein [Polyangium aurulentum]|uniref:STAS domain-containing protein n=1 Tax=Polyangium aurulentum TaxID=2567896 RepID=UPI0010ADB580|nr:STAS domain-containing protein [Polyangium aurulentum]UQA60638.1 PAS domain-containing protein [Polyangium aurulentum]